MNKKWKYEVLENYKKANEKIIAILDEDGHIDKVAKGYYDYKRGVYNLYPTNYGTYSTIREKMSVSIYDVKLR